MGRPEQGVQVGHEVAGGPGVGAGSLAAPGAAWAVVAAHPREPRQLVLEVVPVGGQPAFEHHGGVAVAGAAQEQPPPADVEPAREAALGTIVGPAP